MHGGLRYYHEVHVQSLVFTQPVWFNLQMDNWYKIQAFLFRVQNQTALKLCSNELELLISEKLQ